MNTKEGLVIERRQGVRQVTIALLLDGMYLMGGPEGGTVANAAQKILACWNSHAELLALCKVLALNPHIVDELSTFDPKVLRQVRAAIDGAKGGAL